MDELNGRKGITLEEMRDIIQRSPFNRSLGAEVTVLENGRSELVVAIRPDLLQFHGYVHGAIVGCVADNACAWAAASVLGGVVTAEYTLHFMAPAVGEFLIGRGEVVKATRRRAVTRAEIFVRSNGEERLVATAMATIMPV